MGNLSGEKPEVHSTRCPNYLYPKGFETVLLTNIRLCL